jgi:hypothetical protein
VVLRHWAGERPEAPQLPAYVLAFGAQRVAAVAFGAVRAGDTRYIGLTQDPAVFPALGVPGATRGSVAEFTDWESMLEAWQARARRAGGRISAQAKRRSRARPADGMQVLPSACAVPDRRGRAYL